MILELKQEDLGKKVYYTGGISIESGVIARMVISPNQDDDKMLEVALTQSQIQVDKPIQENINEMPKMPWVWSRNARYAMQCMQRNRNCS